MKCIAVIDRCLAVHLISIAVIVIVIYGTPLRDLHHHMLTHIHDTIVTTVIKLCQIHQKRQCKRIGVVASTAETLTKRIEAVAPIVQMNVTIRYLVPFEHQHPVAIGLIQ